MTDTFFAARAASPASALPAAARITALSAAALCCLALSACASRTEPQQLEGPDWVSTNKVIDRMAARNSEAVTRALLQMAQAQRAVAQREAGDESLAAPAASSAGAPSGQQASQTGAMARIVSGQRVLLTGSGLDTRLDIAPYSGDVEDFIYVIGARIGWRVLSPQGIRISPVTLTYAAKNKPAFDALREIGASVGRNAEILADMQERTLQVRYPLSNQYDPTDAGAPQVTVGEQIEHTPAARRSKRKSGTAAARTAAPASASAAAPAASADEKAELKEESAATSGGQTAKPDATDVVDTAKKDMLLAPGDKVPQGLEHLPGMNNTVNADVDAGSASESAKETQAESSAFAPSESANDAAQASKPQAEPPAPQPASKPAAASGQAQPVDDNALAQAISRRMDQSWREKNEKAAPDSK